MKKFIYPFFLILLSGAIFGSCQKQGFDEENSASRLEQKLLLLKESNESFLMIYRQYDELIVEQENDPFVAGFVHADLLYSKKDPLCKDKNAYAFAKCVGGYIKQGKCLLVMYDGDYYLAYETECPE